MKKSIGIIGAGNIAKAVAKHFLKAGYPVILSSRKEPAALQNTIELLGKGAIAGTPQEAAQANVVLLALPWSQLSSLTTLTDWRQKIVIDATNHFTPEHQLADLNGRASSEVVADYVPGAYVVKAFNTLYANVLQADPQDAGGKRVLFISGDNVSAKKAIANIIEVLGFSAVDLGSLAIESKLQQIGGPLAVLNLIEK